MSARPAKRAKEQGKHLGRPAGRDVEKLAKVATVLARGLSVAEIVMLTGISRASVKRYRQELVLPQSCPSPCYARG